MSTPHTAGQRRAPWLKGPHGKEQGKDGPGAGAETSTALSP